MSSYSAAPLVGVLNAGSSSLKFAFYEGERRILAGQVDGIGVHPTAKATGPDGKVLDPPSLGAKPAEHQRQGGVGGAERLRFEQLSQVDLLALGVRKLDADGLVLAEVKV
jgi:acetate kinase